MYATAEIQVRITAQQRTFLSLEIACWIQRTAFGG
jgi:hypothetical protein